MTDIFSKCKMAKMHFQMIQLKYRYTHDGPLEKSQSYP